VLWDNEHNGSRFHQNASKVKTCVRVGKGDSCPTEWVFSCHSPVPPQSLLLNRRVANVVYGELTVKRSQTGSALQRAGEVTQALHGSNDPRLTLIERIIASNQFRSSLRLREFLLYIADCAVKETPEAATEQQIGVHVFQRSPGYNSSEDSIVRTHARLLRQKLAEYFANDGAAEPTIVEVPKGHYLPIFRLRQSDPPPAPFPIPLETKAAPVIEAPHPPATRRWNYWRSTPLGIALGILFMVIVAGSSLLLARTWPKSTAAKSPIEIFWAPFLSGDPAVLIYSNARFLGDSKTGLRYAPAGVDPVNEPIVDNYTGIGELASVYELTKLFDAHHANFVLKRSLLVTWDEAKQRNLIFIGSPAENPSLNAVPSLSEFTMVAKPESAGFINDHPRPGELPIYSRPEHPLTMDYAVIALMPGVQSGKRTLMFSGLTTLGTQAAVEYASHKDTLAELLKTVSSPGGEIKPFEALLVVTLEGGVPLQSKLISVHVH
jgi:hypothetical protein